MNNYQNTPLVRNIEFKLFQFSTKDWQRTKMSEVPHSSKDFSNPFVMILHIIHASNLWSFPPILTLFEKSFAFLQVDLPRNATNSKKVLLFAVILSWKTTFPIEWHSNRWVNVPGLLSFWEVKIKEKTIRPSWANIYILDLVINHAYYFEQIL